MTTEFTPTQLVDRWKQEDDVLQGKLRHFGTWVFRLEEERLRERFENGSFDMYLEVEKRITPNVARGSMVKRFALNQPGKSG